MYLRTHVCRYGVILYYSLVFRDVLVLCALCVSTLCSYVRLRFSLAYVRCCLRVFHCVAYVFRAVCVVCGCYLNTRCLILKFLSASTSPTPLFLDIHIVYGLCTSTNLALICIQKYFISYNEIHKHRLLAEISSHIYIIV